MEGSGETSADRIRGQGLIDRPASLADEAVASPPSARESQLREEIARRREASEGKDAFLASLAHQLRNPLAPIRNALSFMQVGGNDASAWARGVTIIDRQLANLTRLVDDLQDLSRITRGMVELRPETNAERVRGQGLIERAAPLLGEAVASAPSAAENQLREEIGRLREASERKDAFLATLAHQIRNPLAPIRNALSCMQVGGNDASAWARGMTIIDRQLANLTRLVDDLLDLSHITRGMVELRREPTPLAAILDAAVETSRPVIEESGQALSVSGSPSVWLDVDGARITQALANVLNNAARSTAPGGRIRVTATREAATVALQVEGTGIGIRPEELQSIVDVFRREDRRSPGIAGLGIGLTLAQHLVELHGGDITASSRGPGLGSTISLRLPCLPEERRPPSPGLPFAPTYGEVPQRVLVVDDNQDSTDSLVLLIEMLGHHCVGAYDAATALQRASQIRPHVVFLDIGLPDRDGYEVAKQLRKDLGPSAVLVATTGWSRASDVARALAASFDRHLAKPIHLGDVRELLRRSSS